MLYFNTIYIIVGVIFLLILVGMLLYKFRYTTDGFENTVKKKRNIEIVVSRYNEDLKWLNEEPFSEYQ